MNWKLRQKQMVKELNEKVFSKDPLRVISSALSSIAVSYTHLTLPTKA